MSFIDINQSNLADELLVAESLLCQGEDDQALELLHSLADDAESYIAANCEASAHDQWFSFNDMFEHLAYVRLENDPRTIHDVSEPISRMYADLALAYAHKDNKELAREALKQAVRWNPLDCAARLNLADVYRLLGNHDEYLALSYSVLERASYVDHLARAFCNFVALYRDKGDTDVAAALTHVIKRLDARDGRVCALIHEVADTDLDADRLSDAQAHELLEQNQLPDGANAAIVLCLLTAAEIQRKHGDDHEATNLTLRAVHLVGEDMVYKLLDELRQNAESEQN